jgi:3-carboxy-cis,cis-muconate cycloisomerase
VIELADLFAGTYRRGEAAVATRGQAWLAAMLDVEVALARACEREGLIAPGAAAAIAAACDPDALDVAKLAGEGGEHVSVVVPLVRALRARVGKPLAEYVHLGATSQDIVDTAAMLVARRALAPLLADVAATAGATAALADRHRSTVITGRTLLQQALPTSFGVRAAGWTVALDIAGTRLTEIRDTRLAVQMGGPVGVRSPAIAELVAVELGLADPILPWHTDRTRVAELAGGLGMLAGAVAKIARDVTLLAQNELGELREKSGDGRGGSTAMAHKRNPVAAISVLACARRVPGLVATLLASMEQELERAAGAWQAEWGTLGELLALTGSAASWCRDMVEGLEVDPARMRRNVEGLESTGSDEPDLAAASWLIDRALAAHGEKDSRSSARGGRADSDAVPRQDGGQASTGTPREESDG